MSQHSQSLIDAWPCWGVWGRYATGYVVRDQCPCITLSLRLIKDHGESLQRGSTILIVPKDISSFNPSGHYRLQDTGSIKSGLAWHKLRPLHNLQKIDVSINSFRNCVNFLVKSPINFDKNYQCISVSIRVNSWLESYKIYLTANGHKFSRINQNNFYNQPRINTDEHAYSKLGRTTRQLS